MRSVYRLLCLSALTLAWMTGCSGDDDPPDSSVAFGNHHLWKVGNCEVGTLTPIDPVTGEAEACGNNAREVSECVGAELFKITVHGMEGTLSRTVDGATTATSVRFERSLNCVQEPSLERATCDAIGSALAQDERLLVMRVLDLPPEEQIHEDDVWAIKDKPWPGVAACAAEVSR